MKDFIRLALTLIRESTLKLMKTGKICGTRPMGPGTLFSNV
jgi:hypothetical protein